MVSQNDSQTVIRVEGFAKRYGRTWAVEGVSLQVRRGEIYGLIGPDGAGKSSLMKAIAGVLSYDKGTVQVFDAPVDSERSAERIKGRLGFMPQGLGLNLYPELSIEENVDFFASLRLVPARALADRKAWLLEKTRLVAFRNRPMKLLSGGMKQKLGLVCSLIHAPELVILDEPTTGVDPLVQDTFLQVLREARDEGRTVFLSSHILSEVERVCDRVAIVRGGKLAALETTDSLLEKRRKRVTMTFTAPVEGATFAKLPGVSEVRVDDKTVSLRLHDGIDAVVKAAARHTLVDMSVIHPNLDEIFMSYYEEQQP
jgi:ABC-2 type transport system ATP-binding protein